MKLDYSTTNVKTGLKGLFLFVLGICQPVWAQTDLDNQQDPKVLYDQMISSSENYDYRGILTYEQGGQLQSFSIDSDVTADGVKQKLELLNGPERDHYFLFQSACEKKRKLTSDQLTYYNFYNRGSIRIAGYEGIEIILMPIDKYRNGYQYVVETESKLMLRSMVLKPDRRMIERTQFAQLSYAPANPVTADIESLTAIDVELTEPKASQMVEQTNESDAPPVDQETIQQQLETEQAGPDKVGCNQLTIETGWMAGWLPTGFRILDSKLDGDRAVLVFGDGISTFSVFIDAVIEGFLPPSNAQRGATTVYIDYLSDSSSTYLVSIIGEIPLATADRVLKTLRRK